VYIPDIVFPEMCSSTRNASGVPTCYKGRGKQLSSQKQLSRQQTVTQSAAIDKRTLFGEAEQAIEQAGKAV
jgi:hypothetical protein